MTPIERISEKTRALSALGLNKQATLIDIRTAYKALVLEKHPDRGAGTADEFLAITDAYRFLKLNAEDLGIAEAPVAVRPTRSRPILESTETKFSEDVLAECKSCLSDDGCDGQHVSTMLHRTGRSLTYFVPTTPVNGNNVVVVPTGELVDTRYVHPKVVTFGTNEMSAGVYQVPHEVCGDLFPGARSVKIRFAA